MNQLKLSMRTIIRCKVGEKYSDSKKNAWK
jgi:hypothetical protein